MKFKTVLITGTTSGIGESFLKYYSKRGSQLLCVNRREVSEQQAEYPQAAFFCIDITDSQAVLKLLLELDRSGRAPDLLILNAGINLPDNVEFLNFEKYKEVIETNLFGSMSFVSAVGRLGWKRKTIFMLSSTSNIVPNPKHLSYEHSKVCLDRAVDSLSQLDPDNRYKSVILGPVRTQIARHSAELTGLKRWIFERLAVDSDAAVEAIAPFLETDKRRLHLTKTAVAFYYASKAILRLAPTLYVKPAHSAYKIQSE